MFSLLDGLNEPVINMLSGVCKNKYRQYYFGSSLGDMDPASMVKDAYSSG
jgi:hypothetical protein